ncbi:MAG: trypsin-like peptidase domain-containing protein [Candidatus Latescibacterota bacterium]|nr:MAG: trypsin-like peptidase domain-containing protein [Candidatus Latescibacterota bacterium]
MRGPGALHFVAFMLLTAGVAKTAAAQEDFSSVYEKVSNAVVLIDFEDGAREVGSGVIVGVTVSGQALILTANHVVEGYDEVIVSFSGGVEESHVGKVSVDLYSDTEDMAVIVVQDPPGEIDVICFRESPGKKGESVGTIGHPLGEAFTWSNGSITNVHGKYVIHDARLQRGSSGGPLLDDCSRLLGMNVQLIHTESADSVPEAELTAGTGVAIGSTSIASVLDGWFADTRLKKKWKFKKYCSFWQRLSKQPAVLAVEAVVLVGGVVLLWPTGDNGNGPEPEFGDPPDPPSGQ